jgi:hypothetical protein
VKGVDDGVKHGALARRAQSDGRGSRYTRLSHKRGRLRTVRVSVADILDELVQRLDARDRGVYVGLQRREALGIDVGRMVVPRVAQRLSCAQERDELAIGVVQLAQGPDEKLSRRDRSSPARG